MTVGFFPMCADVLHAGHILALEEARNNCDYLIVGLNCKPDGKNPVQSIYERFVQLNGVKYVDEIIPYGGKSDMELLCSSLDYDIRFLGEGYKNKEWDGKDIETQLKKQVYFVKRGHTMSSTSLKERIVNHE